jgi:hypothetical protein
LKKQIIFVFGLIIALAYMKINVGDSNKSNNNSPNDIYTIELYDLWNDGTCYSSSYLIKNLSNSDPATVTHYYYVQDTLWHAYVDPLPINPNEERIYDLAAIPGLPTNFHGNLIVASEQPISGEILPFPPCDILSEGPPSVETFTIYTFTAYVSPEYASLPIQYTWFVTDIPTKINTGGISDSVELSWNKSGWKLFRIIAENSRGSAGEDVRFALLVKDSNRVYIPFALKGSANY